MKVRPWGHHDDGDDDDGDDDDDLALYQFFVTYLGKAGHITYPFSSVQGMSLSAYTMFLELLPQRWRGIASVLDSTLWAVGSAVMAVVAYLMQGVSWRYLNLALSAVFLYGLCLPW